MCREDVGAFVVVTTNLDTLAALVRLVRASPAAVSVSLLVLAAFHGWWGVRMLLASDTMLGGSQLVCAGALVLAAVGARDRATLGFGLGVAALATAARLGALLPPGPFFAATALLALGYGLAAWAVRRLDAGHARWEALGARGGPVLVGVAYLAFLGARLANGSPAGAATVDFVVRAAAAFVAAAFLDAPPIRLARRNGFAEGPASATR